MTEEKTLTILERTNGWYGGYESTPDGPEQMFNTTADLLFDSLKRYADEGYRLVFLDRTQEADFMRDRPSLPERIRE